MLGLNLARSGNFTRLRDRASEGMLWFIAAVGSDRFEHYAPDMRAVVDGKNADLDAYISGAASMASRA